MTSNSKTAQDVAKQFGGLNLNPAGSSGSNIYGLPTAVAEQPIHGIGDLFPVPTNPDGTASAADSVQAFATLGDPQKIAQIQDLLYKGGYYGNPATNPAPTYGHVTQDDIKAFAQLIETSAQSQADVNTLLKTSAVAGQNQGIQAVVDQINARRQATIQTENPGKLADVIDAEYVKQLGHKPTPAERAGFITAYNQVYQASQQSAIDAQQHMGVTQDRLSQAPPSLTPPSDPGSPGNLRLFEEQASGDVPQPLDAAGVQQRINEGTSANQSVTLPPAFDPTSFAENYVRTQHPDQADSHDVVGQFNNFLNIIKGIK